MDQDAFKAKIADYIAKQGDQSIDAVKRNKDLTKLATDLDKFYWEEANDIVARVARKGEDKLVFSKEDRLLLDAGFMAGELVGAEADAVKDKLYVELYEIGPENVFYFSDWINDRLKNYLMVQQFEKQAEVEDSKEPDGLRKMREQRRKVYDGVGGLFQNLPGVPPQVVTLILSGKLDQHLENVSLDYLRTKDKKLFEEGKKFTVLKKSVLVKVKARIESPAQLKIVDVIHELDKRIWTEVVEYNKRRDTAAQERKKGPGVETEERVAFLQGELKLMKQNINLGVMQAGLRKTHSILIYAEPRTTKPQIVAAMKHVRECDSGFKGNPNVMIAPFRGTGFFEFDRDTMVVPLVVIKEVEESIIDSAGSYRILIDTLQQEGRLKKAFERTFANQDFRKVFIQEYKNWLQVIGRGRRTQQMDNVYDWFKKYVGPNPSQVIGPQDLLSLSPEEEQDKLRDMRIRMKKDGGEFDDYYRLAVLFWKRRRWVDAYTNMQKATELNPKDTRALFSLGAILQSMERPDKAKKVFEDLKIVGENTLWQVYAQEMLQKI